MTSKSDNSSRFLVKPNTLRKLAGKPDRIELEEILSDNPVNDGTLSVEIITLSQHRYELAFDAVAFSGDHLDSFDVEDMANRVDAIISQFEHIQPHIMVHGGDITIVIDCTKIDTQVVEYASILLSQLPSLETGYRWEYLNSER